MQANNGRSLMDPRGLLASAFLHQSLKLQRAGLLMAAITVTHYDVISFMPDFLSTQTKTWYTLQGSSQSNCCKISRGHFKFPLCIDSVWDWLTVKKCGKGHWMYNSVYITLHLLDSIFRRFLVLNGKTWQILLRSFISYLKNTVWIIESPSHL